MKDNYSKTQTVTPQTVIKPVFDNGFFEPYSNHLKGSRKGLRPVPQTLSMIFVKFFKTAIKLLVYCKNKLKSSKPNWELIKTSKTHLKSSKPSWTNLKTQPRTPQKNKLTLCSCTVFLELYSNHLIGSLKGLRPVPQTFSMIFEKFYIKSNQPKFVTTISTSYSI